MTFDPASLERIIPDFVEEGDVTGSEALRISVDRYLFAAKHARAGRLLDIACGAGYGTRILSDHGNQIETALGIDLSADAIDYAAERYGNDRVSFINADAMRFDDESGFDTIVSIETIEHLAEPERFIDRLVSQMKPEAVLVASVPVTPSVDANPHHLHDFTEASFRAHFERHGLVEIDALTQDQAYSLGGVLRRDEARLSGVRRNLPRWYMQHPGSLIRRIGSTLRHGFKNRYLTVVWQRPVDRGAAL